MQNNQVSSIFINIARVIILFATFYGAVKTADVAWAFGDLGRSNGLVKYHCHWNST
ncbi:hypothetical protein ACVPOR_02820 [Staphylococcus aureus]